MNYLTNFLRTLFAPFRILLALPMKLIGAPRKLKGLSFPLRVAVVLAVFLVFFVILSVVVYGMLHGRTQLRLVLTPGWIVGIVLLIGAIPVFVYHALRLWLEGELARYPDIDKAFHEGVAALADQKLELTEIPLFLVLGCPSEQVADNLMHASGLDLLVRSAPPGRNTLRWYGNDRLIFLFCLGSSCLSKLTQVQTNSAGGGGESAAKQGITATMVAGASGPSPSAAWTAPKGPEQVDLRGTLQTPSIQGTLIPGQTPISSAPSAVPRAGGSLSRQTLQETSERFDYICQLLQRARSTLCPLNGVVTVLPLPALQDIMVAEEMPDCIRRDLRSIRQTAMLCCPVTVVVSGMETAAGFSELVRRVGTPRAKNSRFGKGFHVRNTPDGENLEALAAEACGAFEDWVYTLFREEDGLNKPGNGKLYSLLCTVRSQLRQRLRNLLLRGFSADPADGGSDGAPELFSGCYFAATGETPDRQAFVRSILDKVSQLEEEIEWTDEAIEEDERYRRLSTASMVINSLLVVAIVVLVALRFWGGSG